MTWLREMVSLIKQYWQADKEYRDAMKQLKLRIKQMAKEQHHG